MARKLSRIDLYKILTGRTKGDWMKEAMLEAALGGIATPARLGNLVRRTSGSLKKTRAVDRAFKDKIRLWLIDKSKSMPWPKEIYRGVLRGGPEGKEFSHATPWAYNAARGGKGIFGTQRHKVYRRSADKDVIYYRGGALSGDPLESTRISSIGGMTWDEIMRRGKELYYRDLTKQRARARRFGESLTGGEEKYVADKVIGDIYNASFETDFAGKPGIWRGKPVQSELKKKSPRLRAYETIREVAEHKRKLGFPDEDIPELLILKRAP